MNKKNVWKIVLGLGGLGVIFLLVATLIAALIYIHLTVLETCQDARKTFRAGDCADAMIHRIDSPEYSIEEKNHAIWMLGRLGDPKGLPVLNSLFTEVPEDREPLDEVISQYELKKAIDCIEMGTITKGFSVCMVRYMGL